ncbi:MAG: 6,7-dimethyl-8-ribityllumazine synthase [Nitrospirae bacterium]|nr:MAG: 6,7-dimethyl-8-ribityllumazine synthase [Nitrospirota bacterium]
MMTVYEGHLKGEGLRICIVASRFNEFITTKLIEGAIDALQRHGVKDEDITLVRVPGAFELPITVKRLAKKKAYDAIVALGTIIRGATPHFEYVAAEATKGLAQVMLEEAVPVAFGVITSDTIEQAIERAGSKAGNKGWDAALAALEMADLFRKI